MQWIPLMMIYLKSKRTWLFLLYVIIEYLGFGYLLINMFMIAPLTKEIKILLIIFLFSFPCIDELIQSFTPSRISDINDAIVDVIGGLVGSYVRLNAK